ncbi:hypothetical protein HHL22_22165 [Hymenobacter sp. RP-2-7]|uniref:Uncharacterized protein n=1 Tax=Hymenobacter polaris TaxID=2682546 RepID=A0A7Y0AIG8_9BACT|nr:hypothetical protein [Hymenobacter polaris]NML67915.1 hypothetical protein [Hymenobacter polaris]
MLADIRTTLLRTVQEVDPTGLEAAFIQWLYPALPGLQAAQPTTFVVTDYHRVAQLGYWCSLPTADLQPHQLALEEGLRRVAGRSAVMLGGTPAGFATDVVALLGLALAARLVAADVGQAVTTWMASFVAAACQSLPAWKRCVVVSALHVLELPTTALPWPADPAQADLRVALWLAGSAPHPPDDDPSQALIALSTGTITDLEPEAPVAAMRLRTLDWLATAAPRLSLRQPTMEEVTKVLEAVPAGMRRWTWEKSPRTRNSTVQQWNVQNEYHVQNLLYFLLAPLFPDLEDEFYFNPIGQKNPRADLGIPCLRLVIEVKFIRSHVAFADFIEEVAADASLYFQSGSDYATRYQHLLLFFWDDSGRTQEHAALQRGVRQLPHVVGCVVMPRPGNLQP